MKYYHYSDNAIGIGNTIISKSHENEQYDFIWSQYKEVANEMGIYFPAHFGFAYESQKENMSFPFVYQVECNPEFVTKCDFRYSLQLLLEDSFFSPISLRYAMNNLDQLKEHAEKYFRPSFIDNNNELISDRFEIKLLILEK